MPNTMDMRNKLLTSREKEVLNLVIKGLGNKDIANQMVIRTSTVETYLKNIYYKLSVNNRTSAAIKYLAINADCFMQKTGNSDAIVYR